MTYGKILLERVGDIAILRLNDPVSLNALSLAMLEEIDHALDDVAHSSRALLLTGRGRAFCSGANLSARKSDGDPAARPRGGAILESHINPLMTKLSALPIPWVSAVRGAAAGAGCAIALAADLIVVSDTAYFLQAFARIGLVPDSGSSWLLTRAVGRVRAMEMMLLGDRVPAAQALAWGLVNRVVADEALDETAIALARKLAAGPTRTLGLIRRMSWFAADAGWATCLSHESDAQAQAGETNDYREGGRAFLEKRLPLFTGS